MNPLELLEKQLPDLTKSEKIIAEYILANPMSIIRYSLTQVAQESKSSNTAIIRLCQKLGYKGYAEFKFSMSRAALSDTRSVTAKDSDSGLRTSMTDIVEQYVSYLNRMAAETDMGELRSIAALICQASRVAIMGSNRTGFSASQLSYRLSKLGVANHLLTDQVLMKDYMEIFGPNDLCLIFSITTTTCDYKEISQRLKKNGAQVILFTMNTSTPLKKICDHIVCLPRISYSKKMGFLDDQAIFFVFIEVLLSEIAAVLNHHNFSESQ